MRILKHIILFTLLTTLSFSAKAQTVMVDDPVAAMLDSLANKKVLEFAFTKPAFPKNNKYHFEADSIPRYDDYTFEARLAKLDAVSPFDLVYNSHVKGFIDLYTVRRRTLVSRMMGLAQLYYPMFEEVFDRYNIPLELKHLAVIESALNPNARSKAGAQGLWQFMYPTGKMYGLSVTSYIDERSDPYKETIAAAEYLKSLYSMFNDWQMVLAAYNAGPGTISRAIRRSGGKKTYWEIRPFLPKETQGYVPAFIAANYVMNYTAEHNIYGDVPRKTYFEVDTVVVKEPMSFEQISAALDVTVDEIKYFNPQYRKDIIPAGGHALCLQKDKIGTFITNETEIYAAIKAQNTTSASLANTAVKEVQLTHVVKKGQRLSDIARKYGVTVADLKTWNYIGKKGLRPGKKITVYIQKPAEGKAKAENIEAKAGEQQLANNDSTDNKKLAENVASKKTTSTPKAKTPALTGKETYHSIRSGESLYMVSKKYGVSVDQLLKMNGLSKNSTLSIGQKIKIR
ncbi:MAG: transglycosylase SLT domain-containing protein [Bacteroidia bacterium]|nr:transglycosylase SLT domain-containing protein [Bacteroidia bacterium]